MPPRTRRGEIELALGRLVTELAEEDPIPGAGVYAVQAKKLARTLDQAGPEFLATAAVSRELRECVKAMTTREAAGDSDSRTDQLLARLSAPLGHTAN
jgi:hypothetical protein